MRLNPKIHPEDFRCFYSTGDAWGIASQYQDENGESRQSFAELYRKA